MKCENVDDNLNRFEFKKRHDRVLTLQDVRCFMNI